MLVGAYASLFIRFGLDNLQLAPDLQVVLKVAEFFSGVFVVDRVHPRLKHAMLIPLQFFAAHRVIPLGSRGEANHVWEHFME